ncbi:TIGR02444 family protein [Halomonas piscis]|uniref:TIGR02444 family protein n=1 Tax=Halomonas piscis TaxID=3031727 RepID=A0ABY9Z005_9GAMM|nr:TIGR02444 family protein [Halomonas piscis]WNK20432.1 TIGR02444 family protein [Halomonas piscis]
MRDSTRLAAVEQNPLWDFALDFYARPGVADKLLRLQDEAGFDVCVLLWRLWLGHLGLAPTPGAEQALEDIYAWQRDYTRPLRQRRRWLKPAAACDSALAQLRQTIKDAELQAEKAALTQLEALSRQAGRVVALPAGERVSLVGAAGFRPTAEQESALAALRAELVAGSR